MWDHKNKGNKIIKTCIFPFDFINGSLPYVANRPERKRIWQQINITFNIQS